MNPGNSSSELPVSWSRHLSAPSPRQSWALSSIFLYFLQTSMRYCVGYQIYEAPASQHPMATLSQPKNPCRCCGETKLFEQFSMARLESCSKTSIKSSSLTFPAACVPNIERAKLQVHYSQSSCQTSWTEALKRMEVQFEAQPCYTWRPLASSLEAGWGASSPAASCQLRDAFKPGETLHHSLQCDLSYYLALWKCLFMEPCRLCGILSLVVSCTTCTSHW